MSGGAPLAAADEPAAQPIINGTAAADGKWPWMAALFEAGRDPIISQFCGGALIDRQYVVSAAHCLEDFVNSPESLQILLGRSTLSGTGGIIASVEEVVIHPGFDSERLINDVGVIKLTAP